MSESVVAYRLAENEWNLRDEPWSDAIGIEEVHYRPDGGEVYAVPSLVCWFLRGPMQRQTAEKIVALLNSDKEWIAERVSDPY